MYQQPDTAAADESSATIVVATPADGTATETVTLQGSAPIQAGGTAQAQIAAIPPPEVFAEIWKDGMKVGVVYADGEAVLPSTPGGIGNSGGRYPYMRAEEVAQQIGGEVHYVNFPALQLAQTRAQLRAAYGV